MKKKTILLLLMVCVLSLMVGLVGCSLTNGNTSTKPESEVESEIESEVESESKIEESNPESDEDEESTVSTGCLGNIGGLSSVFALLSVMAAAVVLRKKR